MMVSVALFAPAVVGLKVMLSVQVALTATLVHVPLLRKAAALVPESAMLLIVSGAEPVFLIARVWAALVVPTI